MYSQEVLAAPLAMANYTRNPPACPRRMGGFFYPYLLFKSSPLTPGSSQHSARSGCLAAGYWVPVAALQALVAHPLPRIGIYPAADLKSALRPSQSPKDAVACYCVLASHSQGHGSKLLCPCKSLDNFTYLFFSGLLPLLHPTWLSSKPGLSPK